MNEEQLNLLKKLDINANDDLEIIEEKIGDYLNLHCLDENYMPNEDGLICESILDYISKLN